MANKITYISTLPEEVAAAVRVLSQKRLIRQIGTVSEDELAKIREGLVEVLTY